MSSENQISADLWLWRVSQGNQTCQILQYLASTSILIKVVISSEYDDSRRLWCWYKSTIYRLVVSIRWISARLPLTYWEVTIVYEDRIYRNQNSRRKSLFQLFSWLYLLIFSKYQLAMIINEASNHASHIKWAFTVYSVCPFRWLIDFSIRFYAGKIRNYYNHKWEMRRFSQRIYELNPVRSNAQGIPSAESRKIEVRLHRLVMSIDYRKSLWGKEFTRFDNNRIPVIIKAPNIYLIIVGGVDNF